jgi:hypothetical protein
MDIGQNNNYTTDRHTTNIKTNVFNKNIKNNKKESRGYAQYYTYYPNITHITPILHILPQYYHLTGGDSGKKLQCEVHCILKLLTVIIRYGNLKVSIYNIHLWISRCNSYSKLLSIFNNVIFTYTDKEWCLNAAWL